MHNVHKSINEFYRLFILISWHIRKVNTVLTYRYLKKIHWSTITKYLYSVTFNHWPWVTLHSKQQNNIPVMFLHRGWSFNALIILGDPSWITPPLCNTCHSQRVISEPILLFTHNWKIPPHSVAVSSHSSPVPRCFSDPASAHCNVTTTSQHFLFREPLFKSLS